MHNDRSPRSEQMRGFRQCIIRLLITISFLAALGLGAVILPACDGDSCQACRDDCTKNGIPASQCNCEGSCPR
jgi:hypothetical protein